MKTKFFLFLFASLLAIGGMSAQPRAKYIFYFIGDGMGVNQVNGAETYLAALNGRIGIQPLCFPSFPHVALVNTYSETNGVTDSAAGGTALATGNKTKNGAIGMLADLTTPVSSIAQWAHQAGAAVGVSTSVSVDHATPGAFYAHQPSRNLYYEIGQDLLRSDFDFFAGSDFLQPLGSDGKAPSSLYEQCVEAGFTIARGFPDYMEKAKTADKIILFQTEESSKVQNYAIPYAIDRTSSDLTLSQITAAGIDFLVSKSADGFFLMVEGGKIDWACHNNDAATAFSELIDMDKAIRVAYAFYEQHPNETLIVVTADHETGGIVLGRGPYELHTDLLAYQKMSLDAYTAHLKDLQSSSQEAFTWELVKADLAENWGFGNGVEISPEQEARLRESFEKLLSGQAQDKQTLYSSVDELADTARQIMAECALIGWQSTGHSNGYVPVFAVGVGSEQFHGRIDNVEIPLKMAKAAGWK